MRPVIVTIAVPPVIERSRAVAYLELTKPRITLLILVATLVGFWLSSKETISLLTLGLTLAGTGLVASGSAALNMYLERRLDALMARTAGRPLPSARLSATKALLFGCAISVSGVVLLFASAPPLAGFLAVVTESAYLFLYTPLKRRTWLCTLVGAVPGALPVVIGWSAASGKVSLEPWILFAIVFLWQLPHFYAVGWIYREEYARAGFSILPTLDPSGTRTGRQTCLFSILLVVVSTVPAVLRISGSIYLGGALMLGVPALSYPFWFARSRDGASARRLFLFSLAYLPLIFLLLAIDKISR